jgi:hypothetical protein
MKGDNNAIDAFKLIAVLSEVNLQWLIGESVSANVTTKQKAERRHTIQ